jgi:hypothetical protein
MICQHWGTGQSGLVPKRLLWVVISDGGRNTFVKLLCWCAKTQQFKFSCKNLQPPFNTAEFCRRVVPLKFGSGYLFMADIGAAAKV